jgi:hypothetical protein
MGFFLLGVGLNIVPVITGLVYNARAQEGKGVVCLTCHTQEGPTSLFSLPAMMVLMERNGSHPQVDPNIGNNPAQCMQMCHSSSSERPFYRVLHLAHLTGENNHFVMFYGGRCQNCHSLQPDGTMIVQGISNASMP